MNFKKGDKVIIIAGKDTGKEGTIAQVLRDKNKVVIDNINMVKKHLKPTGNTSGSIVDRAAAIDASNVMIFDSKTKKGSRIGHTNDKKGNKIRITKKSKESLN